MKFDWKLLDRLSKLSCDYADELDCMVAEIKSNKINTATYPEIFSSSIDNQWSQRLAIIFQSWRDNESIAPSLFQILQCAIDYFKIPVDHPLMKFAVTCCLLGDIPNNNSYHNNAHFREVVCLIIKLVIVHNEINRNPYIELCDDDIILIICAAAVHDLAHDGGSNFVEGAHVPSRLEKQSISKVMPFLKELKIDKYFIDSLCSIIMATDVTMDENGRSPSGYIRDIFLAHEHDNVSIINVPSRYDSLVKSYKLCFLCLLLCEADVAMSSALDYEFSKEMTKLFAKEGGIESATARMLYDFMGVVCRGGFLSRTSQVTLGQSFQAILLLVEEDSQDNAVFN